MLSLTVLFLAIFLVQGIQCSTDSNKPSYNYTDTGGPLEWYSMDRKNNKACSQGKIQSPINLDPDTIRTLAPGELKINISDVDIKPPKLLSSSFKFPPGKGYLTDGNSTYELRQFHFHTPSEHHIKGEYYPAEVHFVFEANKGERKGVLGVLFDLVDPESPDTDSPDTDSPFQTIFNHIKRTRYSSRSYPVSFRELGDFVRASDVMTYTGSLTTPPCTEGVQWYIPHDAILSSVGDYTLLRKLLKFNA
ncbi:alpha carbonic anhydrase [Aspergillus avenaceus]|uniref:Carbonic anhydrase n=1 Tax=Aspergillus avenaceus TaxID=36643 RepID=A0A5N6TQP8_ASPAV|nr:alpha carbonic anhydrase [Aspergillus avenaceus]